MLNAIEALPEIMDLLTGQFGTLNAIVSGQKRGTWDSLLIGARPNQARLQHPLISFNVLQYPSISFNIL